MEFINYKSPGRVEKSDSQNETGNDTYESEKFTQKTVDKSEEGGYEDD